MVILSILKDLCKEKGITLTKLATEIGMAQSAISESIKRNNMTLSNLDKIAKYLNVPVGFFFGEKELPDRIEKLLTLSKGKFSFFDDTFCFVVKQFADFSKDLKKLFSVAQKDNGVKDKYDFFELLYKRRMLGYTLNIPPLELSAIPKSDKSESEHGKLIYSFLSFLQSIKISENDLLVLRENGIISKELRNILTLWVQSEYCIGNMLKEYEHYLRYQKMTALE